MLSICPGMAFWFLLQDCRNQSKNWRTVGINPPFSACISAECGLIWVYLYLCLYEPINTLQVRPKLARLDRLRNCARHPGKVCQSGICEQIMKSCQNQGQILRKSYFGFSCVESIYRGVKKSAHPNFCEEKILQNYEICLKSWVNFKKI